MKRLQYGLSAVLVAGLLTATSAPATAAPVPPEMDAWLKAAKLGPYDTGKENWAEIVKKAKAEGEVVVYSSSSRIAKIAKSFNALYPEIKVKGFDLGSAKTVEKAIREMEAEVYNVDVIFTGGAGAMINEMLNKNRLVNYVPDAYEALIPKALKEPLLVTRIEGMVFLYNGEAYPDAPPVKNIWELTEPKFRGKIAIKNPLASLSTLMSVGVYVQHADEMAAAYKRHTGKDIKLSPGIPNAGYEFWRRFLKNGAVIFKSGSNLARASGKKGQKKPLIGFTQMGKIVRNESKGYVNRILKDLDPVPMAIYPTYGAIARQAPHPNAAKVFIAYLLGSTKITKDTKLEKPYSKGKSLELLQGFAPYHEPGTVSARTDVPLAEGGELWNTMKGWISDPDFIWREAPKIRDFWTVESAS